VSNAILHSLDSNLSKVKIKFIKEKSFIYPTTKTSKNKRLVSIWRSEVTSRMEGPGMHV
jgi:hypothetical protein